MYTASIREYAEPVLARIDPRRKYITRRLYREDCVVMGESGNVQKDIAGHFGPDLSKVVFLDDNADWIAGECANALVVPPWDGYDLYDETLLNLIPVLDALRYVRDVRSVTGLRLLAQTKRS